MGATGGGGRIRTHERLAPLTVFKTVAFNRSATPPRYDSSCFLLILVSICPPFAHLFCRQGRPRSPFSMFIVADELGVCLVARMADQVP